jgi:hypothetical protein
MKWITTLCLLFIYLCSFSQNTDDTVAIKKLLEKESATYRSGDVKAHADCWKVQPYSIILISTAEGQSFSVPGEAIVQPSEYMGKGGFAVNTNYKMSIHGDNAWVCHDEVSTSKEGAKTYSTEMKMLEKINGEWKLVAASMHFYKKP